MARSAKQDAALRRAFLDVLSELASIFAACEVSGLARRTAYNWRSADPAFAAEWDAALEMGTDALEDEAVRRAYHGVDESVYYGGKAVGVRKAYSDSLLVMLLKARRPATFRERTETHLVGGGSLAPILNVTLREDHEADGAG
ncbi:MAG: terminase [Proteobacteria bacterium]|nr:terminase [Pseudomonadota bacterium]